MMQQPFVYQVLLLRIACACVQSVWNEVVREGKQNRLTSRWPCTGTETRTSARIHASLTPGLDPECSPPSGENNKNNETITAKRATKNEEWGVRHKPKQCRPNARAATPVRSRRQTEQAASEAADGRGRRERGGLVERVT